MVYNSYTLALIASSIFLLGIAYWAWCQKTLSARLFTLLILTCVIYSIGYAFEISSTSLQEAMFWLKVEYLGIALLPAFLVLFAISYALPEKKISRRVVMALFIIPFCTLVLVFTNEYHHLYYATAYMSTEGPFPVIVFERGYWYWLNAAYTLAAIFFSNLHFSFLWYKTSTAYRSQIALILMGSIIPWLGFFFNLFRIIPWNLDLTPYAFTLSSLFIFWGIIRHRLLDLAPVARTTLFEVLPDGVLVIDNNQRIIDLNSVARQYLQIDSNIIGTSIEAGITDWPELVHIIKKIPDQGNIELKRMVSKRTCWIKVEAFPLQDRSGQLPGHMILLKDITERKQVEEQLQILATTDELTDIWNRRYILSAIKTEIARAKRYQQFFSLLMLDIDHFKLINDNFGHAAGDVALRQVSSHLQKRLRKVDIVGRMGGEEFCVILPGTKLEDAYFLAETVRASIANDVIKYNEHTLSLTVSIGVTTYTTTTADVDILLKQADDALYAAKAKGRNCSICNTGYR
ncbi:MAG: diguanylate cyclase [Firmicutes bacterium]|nr:diguanylate cyclase [Bacillota bacterium]